MRIAWLLSFFVLGGLSHSVFAFWAMRTFPSLQQRKKIVWGVVVFLTVFTPIARYASRFTNASFSPLFAIGSSEFLGIVIAVIPFILGRILMDGVERLGKTEKEIEKLDAKPQVTRRQVIEGVYGGAILASTNGVLGWGAVRGRHAFVIEEVPVKIVGLPKALDGYTIAQISDIHVGAVVRERELAEGLDRVREAKPDLVVLTGDLVDFDPAFIPMMARALSSVKTRDGTFAILGNHDYYTDADEITDALRKAGVDVLLNQSKVIQDGFALLGVDDAWSKKYGAPGPRLDLARQGLAPDMPRILLSHQPDTIERFAGSVALQLSGHTHGGQINPGFRPIDLVTHYVSGRYDVRGTTLWINRGFGVAGPPSRVGAPPEVTKIVLVAA